MRIRFIAILCCWGVIGWSCFGVFKTLTAGEGSVFDTIGMGDAKTETVKPTEPTKISITREEQLTIENVQLKLQVLQVQLDSFIKQLVDKYKIDVHSWSYDAVGGNFVKNKQAVKE